jgi:hypothetical protein
VKKVYMAEDPIEAQMVVDLLQAEGIAAMIQGEHIFAVRGALPISYPTVWVLDEADYDRARALALEYDRRRYTEGESEAPRPEPWTCPQCGERIEGQFGLCWQCGAERPLEESPSE